MTCPAPYLSVIIPAYNEERRIGPTLDRVLAYLETQSYTWEILVVLDGCTDGTAAIVITLDAMNQPMWIINRSRNRGKGFTVRQGMLAAKGSIRLFTDADNSTDIEHFESMRSLFESGADVVIASRNPGDAHGAGETLPQPIYKRMLGMAGNLLVQLVAVRGINDTQCGFKAFTAKAAERIFSKTVIDGWGFDIEALALARKASMRIEIVPARWIDNKDTHVTLLSYVSVVAETIRIRWNILRGAYR